MAKIAYVDFCKTLVDFYTLGDFVRYAAQSEGSVKFAAYLIKKLTTRLLRIELSADATLAALSGTREDRLLQHVQSFYNARVLPCLDEVVSQRIRDLKADGYEIVVLSAALTAYIEPLKLVLPIDHVIANRLEFGNNRLQKPDPATWIYGERKVLEIKRFEQSRGLNQVYRFCISDHISDLPMLLMGDQSMVIRPQNSTLRDVARAMHWEVVE